MNAGMRVRARRLEDLHAGLIAMLAEKEREFLSAKRSSADPAVVEALRGELSELLGETKLIIAALERAAGSQRPKRAGERISR